MVKEIYGVNLNSKITPLRVRDAIVQCFFEAHCKDAGLVGEEKEINKEYCFKIVQKAFKETDGNFDNPTKKDIIVALKELRDFSKGFRDTEIIKKHFNEIMLLVEKIDEN